MQKILDIYEYYHRLSNTTKTHLQLLSLSDLYLTIEPTILTQFLSSIKQNTAHDSEIENQQFLDSLQLAEQYGWLSKEKEAYLIKINPIFSALLKKETQYKAIKGLPKAYLDFYSAYCNFLINDYFNSGNEELQIEGVKVGLYEYSNVEKAMCMAISRQEDFLHFFHLLDKTLEAGELHEDRLALAKSAQKKLAKIAQLSPSMKAQQAELISFTADVYYRLGETNEAIENYEKALAKFKHYGLLHNESMVYNNLANIYADAYHLQKAIIHYQKAIESLISIPKETVLMEKKEKTLIGIRLNLGYSFYQNLEYDQAEVVYQEALTTAKNLKETLYEGMLYEKLGLLAYKRKAYKAAIKWMAKANDIYYSFEYTFGIGSLNQNMGMVMADMGKEDNALSAYKTALETFLFLDIPQKIAEVHNNIAYILYHQQELEDARSHYQSGLKIANSLNLEGTVGRCLMGLGSICLDNDEISDAFTYFQQSKDLFEKRQELDCLGDTYLNLSTTSLAAAKNEWAIAYANLAIPIFAQLGMIKNQAIAIANKAKALLEQEKWNLAIATFAAAAQLVVGIDFPKACEYYQQAGIIAYEEKQWAKAEQFYAQAQKMAQLAKEPIMEAWISRSLGYILDEQDKHLVARTHFINAHQLFKQVGEQIAQADIAQILGIYHTELKEKEVAITYFKEAFVIYKSLEDMDGVGAVKENRQTFFELMGEWFEL